MNRHSLLLPGASPPPPPFGRRTWAAPGAAQVRVFAMGAGVLVLLASWALLGQTPQPGARTLPEVLAALTQAAPTIRSVEADAHVVDYTALIAEATPSSGKLYFERSGGGPRYVLDLTEPKASAKKLVYRDHTAYVYTPSAKQVVKYALKGQQSLNQFLLLGMGATGADLTSTFAVTLDGDTTLDGRTAVKLTLTPLSATLKDKLTRLDIWYDPQTWIGIQQQMFQPGGDYHLLTLRHVVLNHKLDDSVFATDFHGATVIIPQF